MELLGHYFSIYALFRYTKASLTVAPLSPLCARFGLESPFSLFLSAKMPSSESIAEKGAIIEENSAQKQQFQQPQGLSF